MGDCVYIVSGTSPPCDLEDGARIYGECPCQSWIFYQGPDCTGGAYADLDQDNCSLALAALPTLAPGPAAPSFDALKKNPQAMRTVLNALGQLATLLKGMIDGSQGIDTSADALLGALDRVISTSDSATRPQYNAATLAWYARNLAAGRNAGAARAKIEARMKAWQAADLNSPLGLWLGEALTRVEPPPDRPGCAVVDPSQVRIAP